MHKKLTQLYKLIDSLNSNIYVFIVFLISYLILWLVNPSNKIIAFSVVPFFSLIYLKIRKVNVTLLLCYLFYSVIFTGKTYPIQLVPANIFPVEIFPNGYFTSIVIAPVHIVSLFMMVLLLRNLFIYKGNTKGFKLNNVDYLVLVFNLLIIISNIFASQRPDISIAISGLLLHNLILYFFVRSIELKDKKLITLIISALSAILIFQSLISFQQFVSKSPIFKNIEYQLDIEYFGKAVDEIEFTFRPLGTFIHANSLGIWISGILILLISFSYSTISSPVLIAIILGTITILMTLSRSAWLGLSGGIFFVLYVIEKIKKVILPQKITKTILVSVLVLFVPLMVLVIPRIEKSLYSFGIDYGGGYFRRIQITDGLILIKENPFFGIGTEMSVFEGITLNLNTVAASIPLAIHNWYLKLALENGIPSLIVFTSLIIITIKKSLEKITNQRKPFSFDFFIIVGLVGGIISCLISGFLQPDIGDQFLWLSLALLNSVL